MGIEDKRLAMLDTYISVTRYNTLDTCIRQGFVMPKLALLFALV